MTTWVFCAGMLRSGSTLQYQIAADIVERANAGARVAYYPEDQFGAAREAHENSAGFLIYKTHTWTPEKGDLARTGEARVLYCYRDIRDVVVSASRKFSLSVEQLLSNGWIDRAIEDSYRWTEASAVLVSRYEDFATRIGPESHRIGSFLDQPLSAAYARLLAARYSLDNQRLRQPPPPNATGDATTRLEGFDQRSLLHHNHIDDGANGKWMFRLTLRQQNEIERRYRGWLTEHHYMVN